MAQSDPSTTDPERELTFSPQGVNVDVQNETRLYQTSLLSTSVGELKHISSKLYGRVLDLAGEIAFYESLPNGKGSIAETQLRVQIERAELDRQKLDAMREKLNNLEAELEKAKLSEARANQACRDLGETTLKLTEWNSHLEARVNYLEAELSHADERMAEKLTELEYQLVEGTQKRIDMQEEFSVLEEFSHQQRRNLLEHAEIEIKLRQENEILKRRLGEYMLEPQMVPAAGEPIVKINSPLYHPDDKEMLIVEDATANEQEASITDIFKTTLKGVMPS